MRVGNIQGVPGLFFMAYYLATFALSLKQTILSVSYNRPPDMAFKLPCYLLLVPEGFNSCNLYESPI